MIAGLAFAFLIGTITTVNPCGFALLPAYFIRRMGTEPNGGERKYVIFQALMIGLSTTTGFVLVFAVVGGAMIFGAYWLTSIFPWTGFGIGILLMLTGLSVMMGFRLKVRFLMTHHSQRNDLKGDFAYGVGYAIVSLSCMLPIFLSLTGASFVEGALSNVLNFTAFALGVGTVLTALSISAALTRNGLATLFKRFLPYIHRISGGFLFLAGVYVSYHWGTALFATEIPDSDMLAGGERISATLKIWLSGDIGQWSMYALLVLLIILSVWSLANRQTRE